MPTYLATQALLPDGWAGPVRIAVDPAGTIVGIGKDAGAELPADRISGVVVPGVPNLHSHAFQRAMAGLAERTGPEGDSFWSWREVMYRFLARLGPEEVEAIAAQAYVEMLKQGYTAVAEFHYLHNTPDGRPYANPAELADRIAAAATAAGIGLTLLPVLYQSSGFGGSAPTAGQRRFVMGSDAYEALVADLHRRHDANPQIRLGIAPHSLRAVAPEALARAVALADRLDPAMPRHIHAAEQVKEVADCLAWSGRAPVEWLLAEVGIDRRWCLVHSTHLSDTEVKGLAASGAVAGLCPSTEGNLGDGLFRLPAYLAAGGQFGIGSDSNVGSSPAEELRWLEYGQRLASLARNVGEAAPGKSTGAALLARATAGGAQAHGRPIGAIAPGHRADLVVLDPDHPALTGRDGDGLLDAWIFSGNATPVRDVMVGGQWVVRDGRHIGEEAIAAAYRRVARALAEA